MWVTGFRLFFQGWGIYLLAGVALLIFLLELAGKSYLTVTKSCKKQDERSELSPEWNKGVSGTGEDSAIDYFIPHKVNKSTKSAKSAKGTKSNGISDGESYREEPAF